MSPYLKIIRPINLVIVFLTQIILYYFVVFQKINSPSLNLGLALLLSLCTCIIAACGYVINDYFDSDIDTVNKPHTTWIGRHISQKSALKYYWGLCIAGFLVSCFIAFESNNIHLIPIYPLAQSILFFYAKKWKLAGFIGNNIVALMASFVSIVIIVAERKALVLEENRYSLTLISAFGIFAFFINLVRELIKDMEDIEGDRLKHSKSLPLTSGMDRTKVMVYFNSIILLIIIAAFAYFLPQSSLAILYMVLCIFTPICFMVFKLHKAEIKADFTFISKTIKVIMLLGLIYLIILSQN